MVFHLHHAECSTPAAINSIVYMRYGRGSKYKNLHRPATLKECVRNFTKAWCSLDSGSGDVLVRDLLTPTPAGNQCLGSIVFICLEANLGYELRPLISVCFNQEDFLQRVN